MLLARGRERLERLAAEIDGEAEPCDVGDRLAVEQTARSIAARHDAVHLLVNNAGVPGRGGFLELEPERIEEITRINYLGSVWCMRAFLPLLAGGCTGEYRQRRFRCRHRVGRLGRPVRGNETRPDRLLPLAPG